jgi:hypothetical protein
MQTLEIEERIKKMGGARGDTIIINDKKFTVD